MFRLIKPKILFAISLIQCILMPRFTCLASSPFYYYPFCFIRVRLLPGSSSAARADFHLIPLRPPKQVFIAGYPKDRDLVISEGFLNLTETQRRGYFAAKYDVYSRRYLESHGLARETRWGMSVQNHMSGGPVLDSSGDLVGVVVNGNDQTAGVLSIENVLSTFFSRSRKADDQPAVLLSPTQTLLYLRY